MVLNKEYPRYLGASAEAHKKTVELLERVTLKGFDSDMLESLRAIFGWQIKLAPPYVVPVYEKIIAMLDEELTAREC